MINLHFTHGKQLNMEFFSLCRHARNSYPQRKLSMQLVCFNLCMVLPVGAILWIILMIPTNTNGRIVLQEDTVISWADELGRRLYNLSRTYSGSDVLQQEYAARDDINIHTVEGDRLVRDMANKMETMLQDKAKAVQRIVEEAENGFLYHVYDNRTEYTYYNAVLVNSNTTEDPESDPEAAIKKELDVTPDSHFDGIPVNITISTVQVPTNVFNQGIELLNSIEATEGLDEIFLENYQQDPTLTWQYFGSRTGYFRVYPGYKWPLNEQGLDLYDCRVRGWYVEGATSSKDVVILVDMSGSMTGLYVEIAKHAIRKILDTFGDNDFVNVISFNATTRFIKPCFNDTLVQATSDHKNLIMQALADLKPHGMADLSNAVRYAFNLLDTFNSTGRGSGCNQAIMIISDMLTERAEDVFAELNPNHTVRVFTYQTGREVNGPTNLIRVACSNRGYYTRLATISDVEELVTSYLHVLSRPMVNKRLRKTVWSSVYWDALGLGLTTTVSQPVFNKRNDTVDKGILEGVAATDVPINEMKKFTPPFKLGVHGYSFAVTNNGYILYHPDLRPLYNGDEVKPNYNSVDLAKVELSDTDDVDIPWNSIEHPQNKLRDSMVNRLDGSQNMVVKRMFDDMKRVSIRNNVYYYTFLTETPYSLGIALSEVYGKERLETPAVFDTDDDTNQSYASICEIQQAARLLFGDGTRGHTIIANWLYCKINYSSSERYEGDEHVAKFLEHAAKRGGRLSDNCDVTMVNHLIFDANVTRIMPDYWTSVYGDEADGPFGSTMFPTDVTSTESGSNIQDILEEIDSYCSPAGQGYTTAASYNTNEGDSTRDTGTTAEAANTRYTTSLPSIEDAPLQEFPDLGSTRDGVVLSFLATYGGLTRIYHNPSVYYPFGDLLNYDRHNAIEEDYFTRAVEEIADGFIYSVPFDSGMDIETLVTASSTIWTERNEKKFAVAAAGFQILGSTLQEFFFNVTLQTDEDCSVDCTPSCFNDSVDCFLVDNHGYIVVSKDQDQVGTHFAQYDQNNRVFDVLIKRGVFRVVQVIDYQGMCERQIDISAAPSLHHTLKYFASLFGWFINQFFVFLSQMSLNEWLTFAVIDVDAQIDKLHYEPCDLEYTFYLANKTNIPEKGIGGAILTDCVDCIKSFSIQSVPWSNLLLVVQDRDCQCNPINTVQLDPVEVTYNETSLCERLLQFKTRRRPDTCFNYDPNEDSSECGRGFTVSPSFVIVLASTLFSLWWLQH